MHLMPILSVRDMPDPGMLMGNLGSSQLKNVIANSIGTISYYSTASNIYDSVTNQFIQDVVIPMQQTSTAVQKQAIIFANDDYIRPLVSDDDFRSIPPCMRESIITYPPVRVLFEKGRIDGFGLDPSELPEDDRFGRILKSGCIEDVHEEALRVKSGYLPIEFIWETGDPDLTYEEREALRLTRRAIDRILEQTLLDPTNIDAERG